MVGLPESHSIQPFFLSIFKYVPFFTYWTLFVYSFHPIGSNAHSYVIFMVTFYCFQYFTINMGGGGDCPGSNCPGGDCPGGDCPGGFARGAIVSGAMVRIPTIRCDRRCYEAIKRSRDRQQTGKYRKCEAIFY